MLGREGPGVGVPVSALPCHLALGPETSLKGCLQVMTACVWLPNALVEARTNTCRPK